MHIPAAGAAVPRRGNAFTRSFGLLMLRVLGWKLEGEFPNVPKAVMVAAPHTSNWDGAITLAVVLTMSLHLHWMGKDSMFRWPFRRLLLWMGGIPVNRKLGGGLVQTTIDKFAEHASYLVLISPEGTRSATREWKTGFYKIAQGAGIPIVLCYIDFSRKVVGFGPLVSPSADSAADMRFIRDYYNDKVARHTVRFEKSAL
jgi:1-acyl-sn-glycerol-3-phosphate acyltransferase